MRLGKDMISVDGPIKPIRAPHHFEANELNYINGTYVYTYNIDWQDFSDWPLPTEKPTTCCMSYMTSKTPLVTKSWKYQHNYMKTQEIMDLTTATIIHIYTNSAGNGMYSITQ